MRVGNRWWNAFGRTCATPEGYSPGPPAFSVLASLTLALGIGATTAIFSVSEILLLRPLPYPHDDRLVALRSISADPTFPYDRAAAGTLADWQIESTLF